MNRIELDMTKQFYKLSNNIKTLDGTSRLLIPRSENTNVLPDLTNLLYNLENNV